MRPAVACRDPFEAAWERVLECVLAPARVCMRRASEGGERGGDGGEGQPLVRWYCLWSLRTPTSLPRYRQWLALWWHLSDKESVKIDVGPMSYPCPSPGHTYDFSLGSGAIILQDSLGSSRWHHLTACSTGSRGHAFLQHAMRLILQQQKQACKAHRPAKKDGVLCRRMRSLRERLCKHAQANEHAACRKA